MAVTSREERLETFWSHLINCALVYARAGRGGPRLVFTAALMRWAGASAINKANGYWLMACDGA